MKYEMARAIHRAIGIRAFHPQNEGREGSLIPSTTLQPGKRLIALGSQSNAFICFAILG
jgi:hypothetical protein